MTSAQSPGLLLLHALPLDGSMWGDCASMLPEDTYAPTLYRFGETLEEWAQTALSVVKHEHLIVVGCSVGGSCALEIALAAPERVTALVLIGTKARHDPDPALHAEAIQRIDEKGIDCAWNTYWANLFAKSTAPDIVGKAKMIALNQGPNDIIRGVNAFHSRKSRAQFLSDCPIPIEIITGEFDTAPGLEISRKMAQSAKDARLHVVPDCGHYVPLEQPDLLKTMLAEVVEKHR